MLSPSSPLAGVALLVTDDHADSADLLDIVLTRRGATVRSAYSAADALALLADFKPDAMLLDISMPDMDGYSLLLRIRAMPGLAHVPAIAVTGHASERDRLKATEAGFAVHTAKPVDGEAVVHLVMALLSSSEEPPRPPTVVELETLLANGGLVPVLRALNVRTSYRFTGLYKYEGSTLRSVALIDRLDPDTIKGEDAPLETTFCGVVRRDRQSFATSEGGADRRAVGLPLRENVLSYCGALLRNPDGTPFGSLCHFDLVTHPVPTEELALLEAFAPSLARAVAVDAF